MRTVISIFVLLFILTSFITYAPAPAKPYHSLEGAWGLVNYYTYEDDAVKDTLDVADGYRQVKLFVDGKVMWSRKVPLDSIEWHGYGAYEITHSELRETLEYGSASMLKVIDTTRVFTFELQLGHDWYRQITLDSEGNRTSSENYVRLGR